MTIHIVTKRRKGLILLLIHLNIIKKKLLNRVLCRKGGRDESYNETEKSPAKSAPSYLRTLSLWGATDAPLSIIARDTSRQYTVVSKRGHAD